MNDKNLPQKWSLIYCYTNRHKSITHMGIAVRMGIQATTLGSNL